jgi:predicted nucleic acid-binding protein
VSSSSTAHSSVAPRSRIPRRLSSDLPVHPVTLDNARLAGRIEGQQEAMGVQFAFEDLLIGATALHLGYEVATLNLRNSQRIPSLSVVQL